MLNLTRKMLAAPSTMCKYFNSEETCLGRAAFGPGEEGAVVAAVAEALGVVDLGALARGAADRRVGSRRGRARAALRGGETRSVGGLLGARFPVGGMRLCGGTKAKATAKERGEGECGAMRRSRGALGRHGA
jgi:hypothetical protein